MRCTIAKLSGQGDGSWSYIGRGILDFGPDDRTLNLGWNIIGDVDTPIHEIGHSLGFPHEHQNPNAGILWDDEAVYTWLAGPPNNWDHDKTFYNIIRKIDADTVQGSSWDPDSIMHYAFKAGLILQPEKYKNGLTPAGGISPRDETWVKTFYPPMSAVDYTELKTNQSVPLSIGSGEQRNFAIQPTVTRYYDIRTFGTSDTVIVLFEDENGELRYRTGADDSGQDINASLHLKLIAGHKYVLRVRLYYADRPGDTAVMMW